MPDTPAPPADLADDVDEVRLLGGRARLRQRRDGYRAGMDAALLAAAVDARPGESVLEAGCGAGGALVQAALRAPAAAFVGVERDAGVLALARANLALNGVCDRVRVQAGDVEAAFRALQLPRADAVFANPPFFDDPTALRAPSPARRGAWMADGGLAAWTRFLLAAVRDGGRLTVIHRADRLGDLLALLGEKAGSFQVRAVHPSPDSPAGRVIVRARRLGRTPLRILPPMALHDADGAPAPLAQAVLAGEASLGWL